MTVKGGIEVDIQIGPISMSWKICVAPIQDPTLLGMDLMRAADLTIRAAGKVYVGNDEIPTFVSEWSALDYAV